MRIRRFKAKKIHGYLDFDIKFFSDVNFLTGINGSGKTTVVNGISALISPSLLTLANSNYKEMEVEIENENDKSIVIWTKKEKGKIQIGSNKLKTILEIPILFDETLDFYPMHKIREEQETFYREQEVRLSDHAVLKLIRQLPSPMFLDIERRIGLLL